MYTPTRKHTHTIIRVNISSQHAFMKFTHSRFTLTLKGSHVTRDEKLEAGAGRLDEVLDVSPGRHLVLLLHLLGAACQVLGHAHLKV